MICILVSVEQLPKQNGENSSHVLGLRRAPRLPELLEVLATDLRQDIDEGTHAEIAERELTGYLASYACMSARSWARSGLSFHTLANSSGVLGTLCSHPGATSRSVGFVREVKKSAVV